MLYFLIGLFSNGIKLDKNCVALFFSVYFFLIGSAAKAVSFFFFFVLFYFSWEKGEGGIYSSCYLF